MFKKLTFITSKNDRLKLLILSFLLIFSTIIELLSIGSIPLYASLILNPSFVINYSQDYLDLSFLLNYNQNNLIIYGSIILIVIFIIKNLFLTFINYYNGSINKEIKANLGSRLFQKYILSDYETHLSRNTAIIIRNITTEVTRTSIYILSFVMLIKEFLILLSVFILLFSVDFKTTAIIFVIFPLVSGTYYYLIKNSSKERGKIIQILTGQNLKTLNHSLGSLKFLKILNKENFMIKIFSERVNQIEYKDFIQRFLLTLPKITLEVLTIVMFSVITISFLYSDRSLNTFIPFITLFCVSAIRIIPSLNLISISFTNIKFNSPAFLLISNELKDRLEMKNDDNHQNIQDEIFNSEIKLKNISYKYPNTKNNVLQNINLSIKPGDKIGILGPSGSGKSTLVDLILGLLKPNEGEIIIDGKKLSVKNWNNKLGYVSQDVYLLDDTIRANVAFGENESQFNRSRFCNAIEKSQLTQFVNSLEKKDMTEVGDRGVRLSGGQKQRIGIARCLYLNPKLIILDEPTSSLDDENEIKIMQDIYNLKEYTIIIISHKNQIFKDCKKIFKVENRGLVEISNSSDLFN